MVYCLKSPFGIISSSTCVNIETMKITSSDAKVNEILANNPSNLF